MSTATMTNTRMPAEPAPSRSAAQRLSERRRHFEAMFLRSFAGMRTRTGAAAR